MTIEQAVTVTLSMGGTTADKKKQCARILSDAKKAGVEVTASLRDGKILVRGTQVALEAILTRVPH